MSPRPWVLPTTAAQDQGWVAMLQPVVLHINLTSETEIPCRWFEPGERVRCRCGQTLEELGPYTHALMLEPTTTAKAMNVHRSIQCPKCHRLFHTIFSTEMP